MANNSTSALPQCCPSLVCLIPAALPHGDAAPNAMPMYMSGPISGPMPIMFPQFNSAELEHFGYNSGAAGFENAPWGATQWPYFASESFVNSEAPLQQPMDVQPGMNAFSWTGSNAFVEQAPQESSVGVWQQYDPSSQLYDEVAVPSQVEMNLIHMQPHVQTTADGSVATLRQRRGKSCASSVQPSIENSMNTKEGDNENDDAEAREIANHVISQFRNGGEERVAAVASFEQLSFGNTATSRAAQLILEEATMNEAAEFATGLRGHVRSAVKSKHANHVIQKITEVMPVARASFIVDELKGFAMEVAQHQFGCRVLCRILEHLSANEHSTVDLVDELLVKLEALVGHAFGSYVVRHILEFGLLTQKQVVSKALLRNLHAQAKDKFGSHVVESGLLHSSPDDQAMLTRQLLSNRDELLLIATSQYGRHVARALLENAQADLKQEAVNAFRPIENELKSSRYGKQLVKSLRASA